MGYRQEILLTGAGGQGLILASIILADAAVKEDKNVVQMQSYGPEARGGESMAGVIMDINIIDYPRITRPTVLLSMNQQSFHKYMKRAGSGCLVIVDSTLVEEAGDWPVYAYPITGRTLEELGREIVANIVALGVVNTLAALVSFDSLKESVLEYTPQDSADLNLRALELGRRLSG